MNNSRGKLLAGIYKMCAASAATRFDPGTCRTYVNAPDVSKSWKIRINFRPSCELFVKLQNFTK